MNDTPVCITGHAAIEACARELEPMLTTTEARAHLTIVETLQQVLDFRMHYNTALSAMWKPLEAFAPRCNCRRVLKFGPWRDGSRQVMCRCGATYWEAQIWRGVPKVEANARR